MDEYVSVTQAAALMKVTRQTIFNWLKWGLKAETMGRTKFIKRTDLLAFEPGKAGRKAKEQSTNGP